MLGKLLKYDSRHIFKRVWFVFPTTLLLAGLARLRMFLSDQNVLLGLLSGLSVAGAFLMIGFCVIFTYIVCLLRFMQSMIRDEGYLTHTLPVTATSLVFSKLIVSFVAVLLSIISVVGSIGIMFGNPEFFTDVRVVITELFGFMYGLSGGMAVFVLILTVVVYILYYIVVVYACLALGQLHNKAKIGFAFMYGGIFYVATQLINTVVLVVLMFLSSRDGSSAEAYLNFTMWFNLALTAVVSVAAALITCGIFTKRKNLEMFSKSSHSPAGVSRKPGRALLSTKLTFQYLTKLMEMTILTLLRLK